MPSVDGVNYPGPFEIRIFYSTVAAGRTTLSSVRMSVDVDSEPAPGSPFSAYDLVGKSGLFYTAETWVDAFIAEILPAYHTTSNFSHAELWKYQTGTFNADFKSSYAIGLAGTGATATNQHMVSITTFRSQNGGSARLTLVQPTYQVNVTDVYPFVAATMQDVSDLMIDANTPVLARDGGYLFNALHWMVGQNEKLFKDTNRP